MELNEKGLEQVPIENTIEKKIFNEEMQNQSFENTENLKEHKAIEIKTLFHQLYEKTDLDENEVTKALLKKFTNKMIDDELETKEKENQKILDVNREEDHLEDKQDKDSSEQISEDEEKGLESKENPSPEHEKIKSIKKTIKSSNFSQSSLKIPSLPSESPFPSNPNSDLSSYTSQTQNILSIPIDIFLQNILSHKDFIENLFTLIKKPKDILKRVINRIHFSITELQLYYFPEEILVLIDNNRYINSSGNLHYDIELSFDIFFKAVENLYISLAYPNPFRDNLMKSFKEYEEMKKLTKNEEDLNFINNILIKLKGQIVKSMRRVERKDNKDEYIRKVENNLREIFYFYAKQQNSAENSYTTFDELMKNYSVINLTKFLLFVKDFKIVKEHTNPKKISEQIQTIQDIYRKNSDFLKKMKINHFIQAVKDITEIFFDNDYDKQNNTDFCKLDNQEKYLKFYEIMQFDNSKEFRKKLVGAPHFGVQESRIPSNDLSKNYKFRPKKMKQMKQNIKKWQLSKALDKTIMKSRPLPLEKSLEKLSILKKPVKIGSFVSNALSSQIIKDEYDLSDLIDEKSSDEELYLTLNKSKSHNLSQEIPGKILKRANELNLSVQKQENKKMDDFLKSTSKYFARAMKYAGKKK
ncbi:hypothetical protein SteCoe_27724 [Stentor coeruleus]|uniref:Uncharacterized protein n=1 Tax=Stentor coeruleus TaxID=5963 RepID=A0A1R2BAD2_9CILI|nr:hypothetical protein SteCoe_27724 [Stentor coeruleus]